MSNNIDLLLEMNLKSLDASPSMAMKTTAHAIRLVITSLTELENSVTKIQKEIKCLKSGLPNEKYRCKE